MRKLFILLLASSAVQANPCQTLDLDTAWQRVLYYAPSLRAADEEIEILRGQAEQVSTRLNPVVEVESENLGISHPTQDTEPPQTTFSLAQTFELGGKRAARLNLASSLTSIAACEALIEREDAFFDLTTAFLDVKIAQERMRLAKEKLALSERCLDTVKRQIENGKISPIQERRVYVEMMSERMKVREAQSEFEQARMHLSSMWGCDCPDFETVDFQLFTYCPPPCNGEILEGFYQTPDYYRAQQTVDSACRNLALQRANRIPDVTLMAGYRVFHDSNSGAWVVGFEMPLPFFDRNQGNVRSACAEMSLAESSRDEVIRSASEKILIAYEKLVASYEETKLMSCNILKEAEAAYKLTCEGYEKGKIEYLEVLETKRMLCEIQESYLNVLHEYHMNRAVLARLSGMNL